MNRNNFEYRIDQDSIKNSNIRKTKLNKFIPNIQKSNSQSSGRKLIENCPNEHSKLNTPVVNYDQLHSNKSIGLNNSSIN